MVYRVVVCLFLSRNLGLIGAEFRGAFIEVHHQVFLGHDGCFDGLVVVHVSRGFDGLDSYFLLDDGIFDEGLEVGQSVLLIIELHLQILSLNNGLNHGLIHILCGF